MVKNPIFFPISRLLRSDPETTSLAAKVGKPQMMSRTGITATVITDYGHTAVVDPRGGTQGVTDRFFVSSYFCPVLKKKVVF